MGLAGKENKNDALFVGALHQLRTAAVVLLLYRHFMSDVTASLTEVIPSTVTWSVKADSRKHFNPFH